MSEVIAGIRIPDSKLAREATDLLREHGTALLFAHSLRVFLFGALRGRHRTERPGAGGDRDGTGHQRRWHQRWPHRATRASDRRHSRCERRRPDDQRLDFGLSSVPYVRHKLGPVIQQPRKFRIGRQIEPITLALSALGIENRTCHPRTPGGLGVHLRPIADV